MVVLRIISYKQKETMLGIFVMVGGVNKQRINNDLIEIHKYFMLLFLLGLSNGCTTVMFS